MHNHLEELENESIYILREIAAQFQKPVLLFSGGKDSITVARLAQKAFYPAKIPWLPEKSYLQDDSVESTLFAELLWAAVNRRGGLRKRQCR